MLIVLYATTFKGWPANQLRLVFGSMFGACREAGLNLELSDVAVQSLVPAPLQNVASADDFMQQLPQYDADLAQQVSEADAAGECLRFVGKFVSATLLC